TAWLYSVHRHELAAHFRLYQPPEAAVYALLNKRELFAGCAAVGLQTPETHFPGGEEDLKAIAERATVPLLVKPQSQVLVDTKSKGLQVASAGQLALAYRAFVPQNRYAGALLERHPDVVNPLLQAFHTEAADSIYSVSGFIDETGELTVARAA